MSGRSQALQANPSALYRTVTDRPVAMAVTPSVMVGLKSESARFRYAEPPVGEEQPKGALTGKHFLQGQRAFRVCQSRRWYEGNVRMIDSIFIIKFHFLIVVAPSSTQE